MEQTSKAVKRNGNSVEWREKRASWLIQNPNLWDGINPFEPQQHRAQIDVAAKALKEAGLYSVKTEICDIRSGLIKLLKDPRFQKENPDASV